MKFVLVVLFGLGVAATACKLEPSSATANANANANAAQPANVSSGNEQEPKTNCSLSISVAPDAQGLKLRMSPDEVLGLFPGSKDDAEVKQRLSQPASPLGVSELTIRPEKFGTKEKYSGVAHINFSFLDGKVSTINVSYKGPAYSHVDEFVKKFVQGTSLPPADQWQAYVGMENQLKILTCKDFEVRVFSGGEGGNQNYAVLTDLEAKKTLKDRREKAKAKASPTP